MGASIFCFSALIQLSMKLNQPLHQNIFTDHEYEKHSVSQAIRGDSLPDSRWKN